MYSLSALGSLIISVTSDKISHPHPISLLPYELHKTSSDTQWRHDGEHLLFTICGIGLLGHMCLFMGYHWLSNGKRNLPYWGLRLGPKNLPLVSFQPISSYLFRHQQFNNLLVYLFILFLTAAIFGYRQYLLPSVLLFASLCLFDLWRLFYHHYYLFALAAFLFPLPQISLQIILASTYFWSGFNKLVMPEFYSSVAPTVFRHVDSLLAFCLASTRLSSVIGEKGHQSLFNFIAGMGVAMEMIMGLVLFFPAHVPSILLYATLAFNIFLHAYIIVFIGLANGMHAFISWNTWCALLVQQLFAPSFDSLLHLSHTWHAFHWFTFLAMTLPPILMLFGKCPHAGLSHTHFAPGWYGTSTLFLPIKALPRIPRRANGQELPYYTLTTNAEGFEAIFHLFIHALSAQSRRHNTSWQQRVPFLRPEDSESEAMRLSDEEFFKPRCVVLGDEWYHYAFNYGEDDPCQIGRAHV